MSGRHSNRIQQQPQQSSFSENPQLTVMLTVVSVTALLLQLPYIICYIVKISKWSQNNVEFQARLNLAYTLTQLCSLLNYAINFLLYCVSGCMFRQRVIELVSHCRSYRCTDRVEESSDRKTSSSMSSTNFNSKRTSQDRRSSLV